MVRVIFLLGAMLCIGTVYSQDPPKPQANGGQKQSASEQRGTENAPFVVRGEITTKKNKAETENDAAERDEEHQINKSLVKYTGLTALFAFLAVLVAGIQAWFFWRQLRLMNKGVEDAYQVAMAAKSGADLALKEFNETHHPCIHVRRLQYRPANQSQKAGIEFILANVGDTIAKAVTINTNIRFIPVDEKSSFERGPFPSYGTSEVSLGDISDKTGKLSPDIGARERRAIVVKSDELIEEDYRSVLRGEKLFYFFGLVTYHDALNVRRDTGFFRCYDPDTHKFEPAKDPDYEWQ